VKGPESGRSEGCITPQKARVVEMKLRQVGDSHKMGMGGQGQDFKDLLGHSQADLLL
jgi:hypothetical protein